MDFFFLPNKKPELFNTCPNQTPEMYPTEGSTLTSTLTIFRNKQVSNMAEKKRCIPSEKQFYSMEWGLGAKKINRALSPLDSR